MPRNTYEVWHSIVALVEPVMHCAPGLLTVLRASLRRGILIPVLVSYRATSVLAIGIVLLAATLLSGACAARDAAVPLPIRMAAADVAAPKDPVVVRVAYVSEEPPNDSERAAIQATLDDAQAAVAEASSGALRIRFDQLEHVTHRVTAPHSEAAYAEVAKAVEVSAWERVIAFIPQARRSWPGMAGRPLTNQGLAAGSVAMVWRDAWQGPYRRYRVALHELFHTLGAVYADAPASDGRGHSLRDGDLMKGYGYMYCPGRGWRVIDCGRNSYFNLEPPPGSWLAENPEWNIALSPFLERTTEHEQ